MNLSERYENQTPFFSHFSLPAALRNLWRHGVGEERRDLELVFQCLISYSQLTNDICLFCNLIVVHESTRLQHLVNLYERWCEDRRPRKLPLSKGWMDTKVARSTVLLVQRRDLIFADLVKQDPGRARQNTLYKSKKKFHPTTYKD